MQDVYCGHIGFQYMHIANHQKNNFVRRMIEADADRPLSKNDEVQILDRK